jgi:hypothetical protein
MKTLLYTGHDAAYKPLADITVPRMAEYAERHGFDFTCHTEPLIQVPNGIYWTGVCGALQAFEDGYDRAIYLDVDQLVTNMEFKINPPPFGIHVSKDWGNDAILDEHFSACGIVSHMKDSERFMKNVLFLEPAFRDKDFPEQAPLQSVYKHQKAAELNIVTVHPRKVFNCVPDQVCPGAVPEPWAPGDWCAHLTMVDLARRIEIAKEILSSL